MYSRCNVENLEQEVKYNLKEALLSMVYWIHGAVQNPNRATMLVT